MYESDIMLYSLVDVGSIVGAIVGVNVGRVTPHFEPLTLSDETPAGSASETIESEPLKQTIARPRGPLLNVTLDKSTYAFLDSRSIVAAKIAVSGA